MTQPIKLVRLVLQMPDTEGNRTYIEAARRTLSENTPIQGPHVCLKVETLTVESLEISKPEPPTPPNPMRN